MNKLTFGIDIGGTTTAIGLVSSSGKVIAREIIPTPTHGDEEAYADDIFNTMKGLEKIVQKNENIYIEGIGIGAPNGNRLTGNIEHTPNINVSECFPIVDLLKERTSVPIILLTNDANAAAHGELVFGQGKNINHFAVITLGTGCGSGIVVDGKVLYGHDGLAGEVGHTMVIPNGRMCGCGVRGHADAYCSATGMKRTIFELIAEYNDVSSPFAFLSYNELTAKMVYEAAKEGDKIASEAFARVGQHLGITLSNIINLYSPEVIFLFGGLSGAGDLLFEPTRKEAEKRVLTSMRGKTQIKASSIPSGDAAILGAAALVKSM